MKKPIDLKLTQEGYQRLIDEERDLKENRPGVLKRMVEAREQGDLSENAGYHAARERLGYIDSRLRQLKIMIRFADVVKSSDKSAVTFGNSVTVKKDGVEMTYRIVSAQEADPMLGKISEVSPIGRALIDKAVGETAQVETPEGKFEFEIVDIKV